MLARVRTPSSLVRERERERERDVEYGYWTYFIAFNNSSFKRNEDALAPFSYLVL